MPSTKGCVSPAPDGRHNSVSLWPTPGEAALVELLVAGAVEVLFVVAVANVPEAAEPAPAELPEEAARGLLAVTVLDVVVVVGLAAVAPLVELVAMPSIVAPRPAVPAEAEPPPDEPLPELGGVETVTVGVLVSVAPEVTEPAALLPVLVRVCPEVTADDGVALVVVEVDRGSVGSVTAPLPTWPCPELPGVGPPTGSVASGFTVCAAAGSAGISANPTAATMTRSALMPRQRGAGARVPDCWLRRCASATVGPRRTGA